MSPFMRHVAKIAEISYVWDGTTSHSGFVNSGVISEHVILSGVTVQVLFVVTKSATSNVTGVWAVNRTSVAEVDKTSNDATW